MMNKWDYRGVTLSRKEIEKTFAAFVENKNRYASGLQLKVISLINAVDLAVKTIDAELKAPTIDGDFGILYDERRKLQVIRRQIIAFGKQCA